MNSFSPESGEEPVQRPELLEGQQFPTLPQQERSRKKREALLQAALELFGERGYEESTVEEIAKRAKVAVGGFYQHFASKRQILLALMDRFLQEVSVLEWPGEVINAQAAREVIIVLVRRGVKVDVAYAGAYRAWKEAAAQDRELREMNGRIEQWSAALLEGLFRGLLGIAGARQGIDIAVFAWEMSLLFWRLLEVPFENEEAIEAVIGSMSDIIYHNLFMDQEV